MSELLCPGYKIPAGQAMIASFWSLHRDESLWENAEAFMPERWLDHSPKAVERRQNAWKAFGACLAPAGHTDACPLLLVAMFQKPPDSH